MGKTFKKQIFPLGKHFVSDSKGNKREIEITKERALSWINKFNNMRSQGLIVTAPWEHDIDAKPVTDLLNAKNNGGEWKSLYLENDMVIGHLEAATDEDEKNIGTKVDGCSIFVDNFVDGTGKEWDDSILHICLTNHPVAITEGYEPTENSLSIAMSTVMEKEKSAGTNLEELASTLKARLGIDLPVQETGIHEYIKMLIAVFKNFSNGVETEQMQTVTPAMDIYMSTNAPSKESEPSESTNYKQQYLDLKKRIQGYQKREKALLDHISTSVVDRLGNRLGELKKNYSGENEDSGMLSKISDLESSLNNLEFEFDFKDKSLSKTTVENQIEMMELFSKREIGKAPTEQEENLTGVTPDDEPDDNTDYSYEELTQAINSF